MDRKNPQQHISVGDLGDLPKNATIVAGLIKSTLHTDTLRGSTRQILEDALDQFCTKDTDPNSMVVETIDGIKMATAMSDILAGINAALQDDEETVGTLLQIHKDHAEVVLNHDHHDTPQAAKLREVVDEIARLLHQVPLLQARENSQLLRDLAQALEQGWMKIVLHHTDKPAILITGGDRQIRALRRLPVLEGIILELQPLGDQWIIKNPLPVVQRLKTMIEHLG